VTHAVWKGITELTYFPEEIITCRLTLQWFVRRSCFYFSSGKKELPFSCLRVRKMSQADTALSIPAFTALSLQGSSLGANRGKKSCDRKAKHKGSPSVKAKAAYRKNLNQIRK